MVVDLMLWILIVISFTFLLMRLIVAGYNYFNAPVLVSNTFKDSDLLSILIPARNEEGNIGALLDSILQQQQVKYEVIVLDDHSTDRTGAIVKDYASRHPEIKLLQGQLLPEGWTGKNFACYQLAQEATGKYLLFIDADVILEDSLVSTAVGHLKNKSLTLLSLFCQQQTTTFGEKITVPLMNYLLLTLLPLKLIESHADPIFSAACGQFMLFDGANYRTNQWHLQVRGQVTEDLAIMKKVKENGNNGEGMLSGKLMTCRMYGGFYEAVNGFSKNFIAPFNDSIPLFIAFLTVVIAGPIAIISTGNLLLITALISLVTVTRFFTGRLSGEPVIQIILHPFQMLSFLCIGIVSIYHRYAGTGYWKGRKVVKTVFRHNI